jgi:DNA-binding NarL/FixJ family response regulator
MQRKTERLLVVDDEPNLLRAVEACLQAEGYEVLAARSAKEALVQMATYTPDLIVTDIRMPGMDGFEFARHLHQTPATSLIPVMFLTAKGEMNDRVKGFRSGVDAYLTKPFEPEELLAAIEGILRRVKRTHAGIARVIGAAAQAAEQDRFHDEELTEAEIRMAELVARGLSNKEIAAELEISVRTVENHISHILDKKGFNNRVEIARMVLEQNLSDPGSNPS